MIEPGVVAARRVGLATRVSVAVVIGLPPGALFVPLLYADPQSRATSVVGPLAVSALNLAIGMVLNQGFAPRVRGSVLVVWTLLGRQTVDLSALVAVGTFRWVLYRGPWLRLSDPVNMVAIRPLAPGVRNAVAHAVWEAAGRGVSVGPQVEAALDLPPLPGMTDFATGVIPQLEVVLVAIIGICVSAGAGVLWVLLAG